MIEKLSTPATNTGGLNGHTIRTCLNGKVKEILCDSAFQVKTKAASAMMGQLRKGIWAIRIRMPLLARCHRQ